MLLFFFAAVGLQHQKLHGAVLPVGNKAGGIRIADARIADVIIFSLFQIVQIDDAGKTGQLLIFLKQLPVFFVRLGIKQDVRFVEGAAAGKTTDKIQPGRILFCAGELIQPENPRFTAAAFHHHDDIFRKAEKMLHISRIGQHIIRKDALALRHTVIRQQKQAGMALFQLFFGVIDQRIADLDQHVVAAGKNVAQIHNLHRVHLRIFLLLLL